jgi:hypothetical protein
MNWTCSISFSGGIAVGMAAGIAIADPVKSVMLMPSRSAVFFINASFQ